MMTRIAMGPERCTRRIGFTLVEMLVVILIVSVVIAIVVPAVGGAKRAAKKAATQQLVTQVTTAAITFEQDNRRIPGYWSPADMGHTKNADENVGGLSSMENILLDLSGGIASIGRRSKNPTQNDNDCPIVPATPFDIGMRTSEIPWVDVCQIGTAGATNKGYFTPPAKYFARQENKAGLIGQATAKEKIALPDLVDAFGTPIIAWSEDQTVTDPVDGDPATNNFARIDSTTPARFYWNSNACFLKATALGVLKTDQTKSNNTSRQYSLIGQGVSNSDRTKLLTAMLGAPTFPNVTNTTDINEILPAASRSRLLIHAAGPDGYYFGSKSKVVSQSKDGVQYGYQHIDPGDSTRRAKSIDYSAFVEDILAPVGN